MSLIKSNFPNLTDFFSDEPWGQLTKHSDWSPAVNVVDNDTNYEIEVAAPGLKKSDFNVEVSNGVLLVSGTTENEKEEKKKNYTRHEFSSRSFSKSFTMPENVDSENIKATHEDGVLKLRLAKSAAKEPQKVTVEVK